MSLSRDDLDALRRGEAETRAEAARLGLDVGEVDFHVVPAHHLYEVASYGIPGHFRHWSYGRDYWRQKASYDRGQSRIYELVVNASPAQAFLLETNTVLENITVMAHVAGHCAFFRSNALFAHTNRRMPDSVRAAAERFAGYELEFGRETVEAFLDHAMSVAHQVDPHQLLHHRELPGSAPAVPAGEFDDLLGSAATPDRATWRARVRRLPQEPTADLLGFLSRYGDLEDWQRDVLQVLREEALYFLPQRLTKLANEGFASLVHQRIMQALDVDTDPLGVDFARMHAGVVAPHPGRINPYLVGWTVLRRIAQRWDEPGRADRDRLGLAGGVGWARVLEAVACESDVSLLRNYLDEATVRELDLFSYLPVTDQAGKPTGRYRVLQTAASDWEQVRDTLVASIAGGGVVDVKVVDGDWHHTGQLLLRCDDPRPLDLRWAGKVCESLRVLWGRPVHLVAWTTDGFRRLSVLEPGTACETAEASAQDLADSGATPPAGLVGTAG